MESAATDFNQVVDLVNGTDISDVTNKSDLNGFNGYVIKLTITGEQEINLYAFRYIATAWSVTNSAGKTLCFDNDLVADVSSEPRFTITENIDMIQLGESMFIADIKKQSLIYHLTSLDNVPSILDQGLLPRSELTRFTDVADGDILSSREGLNLCHPLASQAIQLLGYEEGFDAIDWDAMNKRDYHDPHSKSVCMAECLSPGSVGPGLLYTFFVRTDAVKLKLSAQLVNRESVLI